MRIFYHSFQWYSTMFHMELKHRNNIFTLNEHVDFSMYINIQTNGSGGDGVG